MLNALLRPGFSTRRDGTALLAGTLLCCLGAGNAARADEAADRAQLNACVSQHLSDQDKSAVRRLFVIFISDGGGNEDDLKLALASKHEPVFNDAAGLINRLVQKDCHNEILAEAANRPTGGAFGVLFGQLSVQIKDSMMRGSVLDSLELMKKLDPAVFNQLGLATAATAPSGTPAATTPPSGPVTLNRAAVSGVRVQIGFETALNPDCTEIGPTTIRISDGAKHGTAVVEAGKGYSTYPSTNQRYHCNEKPSKGTLVQYQSSPGYVGSDQFSYSIIYPTGGQRQYLVNMAVNQ